MESNVHHNCNGVVHRMKNENEHFDKFLRLAGEKGFFRKTQIYPTNSNVGCILLLIAVVT